MSQYHDHCNNSQSAEISQSHYRGEGVGTNFQVLLLSPNLLKSQSPAMVEWGTNFQILMQSQNLLKSHSLITAGVGGGGGYQLFNFQC